MPYSHASLTVQVSLYRKKGFAGKNYVGGMCKGRDANLVQAPNAYFVTPYRVFAELVSETVCVKHQTVVGWRYFTEPGGLEGQLLRSGVCVCIPNC